MQIESNFLSKHAKGAQRVTRSDGNPPTSRASKACVHPCGTIPVQKREYKSTSCGTCQALPVVATPRELDLAATEGLPGLLLTPKLGETGSFIGEATSNLPCKHHEASPASITPTLSSGPPSCVQQPQGVRRSLWLFRAEQRLPLSEGRPELCRLPFAHPEEGQSRSTTTSSILVSDWSTTPSLAGLKDIGSDPPTGLAADSCGCVFQREPSASQRPHDSTRRLVMAKDVKRTATSANASCEGTQTAEEQDPQGLRFQTRHTIR